MPNFALLNNVAHKNLRVIRDHTLAYGDNEMVAVTFPQEFRTIQNEYPIFFQKNPETGKFSSVALMGLRQQENLFLSEKGWDAHYIPASVKRRPFLIGVRSPKPGEEDHASGMVYVDMDSPRVNEDRGDAVFLPHGGYSPYLESIIELLEYIQYGTELNDRFIDALLENELLEIVKLEITLTSGEQNNLIGFYTINEDRLLALDGESIISLHSKGYLEFIYMILASHTNVSRLISRIEARRQDQQPQ